MEYCPNPKRKNTKKVIIIIVLVITLLSLGIYRYLRSLSPMIVEYSNAKITTLSTTAINRAVFQSIQGTAYSDFVEICRDKDGNIASVESNTMLMNAFSRIVIENVENEMQKLIKSGIEIPMGNLTKLAILSGIGPNISVTIRPYERVTCEFVSEFTSVGINQTLHKIYLKITTSVSLIIPTHNEVLTNTSELLLAEAVIVGQVPETYLNFGK